MRVPGLAALVRPAGAVADRFGLGGGRRRRVWAANGHAHIEAHAIQDTDADAVRTRLQAALERLDAVQWAEVNAVTRRVAVAFDSGKVNVDTLVNLVSAVEEASGVRDEEFPEDAPDHPGDPDPARRALVELVADVAGLGLALAGRALRRSPVPIEAAALLSFVESQPRLRSALEQRLGTATTDVVLSLATSFAQGVAEGPTGLVIDIAHRADLLVEARARRRVWEGREPDLYRNPAGEPIACPDVGRRPATLPDGPVERYADRAGLASLGGFAVTLAATRDARRAAQALLAGLPKAARLGRESFCAQLDRTLAARGVVTMDPRVLRRLDRVDTVVVDREVLVSGRPAVDSVVPVDGSDPADLRRHAEALVGGHGETHRDAGWALGPLDDLDATLPRGTRARARELGRGGVRVRGLAHEGAVRGLVGVVDELDPAAFALAAAVRRAGHRLVVAGTRGAVGRRLGADRVVARGGPLGDTVRELQAGGAVVLVVAARSHRALAAADCGVALLPPSGRPSWCAHLLADRDLDAATFVVEASAEAARVSRRSATLAAGGSALGGLLALTGPRAAAGYRALAAVNGASVAAMAAGTWSGVALGRRPRPVRPDPTPWHVLDVDAALRRARSDPAGLGAGEAAERRAALPEQVRAGGPARFAAPFLAELANPITPILGLAAGTSAIVGSVVDAGLVAGLIGVNTALGGAQRLRTERTVDRLLAASAPRAVVRRDGEPVEVAASDLVAGDVVVLEAGDVVPADCRLLTAAGLETDDGAVTGESLPVAKTPAACPEPAVADRACMLYEGTTVVAGAGEALVVATGPRTASAQALLGADTGAPTSGVEARLSSLTRRLLPASLGAAGGVAGLGLWRGWPGGEVVSSAVSLAVASVPEGLPFVASAAQLSAARRLAGRGAIVSDPRTIEALGRADVLCFDKTGTLTEGRLRLRHVSDGSATVASDALGDAHRRVLAAALRASPGRGDSAANATDEAVHLAATEAGVGTTDDAPGWQEDARLPFEASRGLQAARGRCAKGPRLSVKGAPEEVLERCSTWRGRPLDDAARAAVTAEADRLAREGLRVLAVGERSTVAVDGDLDPAELEGLELLGYVALGDRVRPTAAAAIGELQRAGVAVLMMTGDHPHTAATIAAELGIGDGHGAVTGEDLDTLDDGALVTALEATQVVARVAPGQKLRIVRALQDAGRTVVMTGDGANDAPAIRLADTGVALGERATPTARQAADVIVTNGQVETLVDALVEGRALWRSVRDALAILVGGNLGEMGFALSASTVARRAPMSARQFLLVNLLTDLAPAMAVVLRQPDRGAPETLLSEGPDRSLGPALVRDLWIRGIATGGAATGAWLAARATGTRGRARTVALVALVGAQLGQTVVAGGRSRLVAVTALGSAAALAGIVQTPGVSHFFGCRPLGPVGWATATGAALAGTGGAAAAERLARRAAPRTEC